MSFFPEISLFSRNWEEWSDLLYDDREMCSLPAPSIYSMSLTSAHLFAAPIYFAAFYSLYSERTPSFQDYKRYLSLHVISNIIFEFHLSVVMRPVLYLPYIVVRFVGAYHLRFVNGNIWFFLFYIIIIMTCLSIVDLFYYRMKVITSTNLGASWISKLSDVIKSSRYFLFVVSAISVLSLCLCINGLFDQSEHKKKLKVVETNPEIMCMSGLTIPDNKLTGFKPIHLFNIIAFSVIVFFLIISFTMGFVSLISLRYMMYKSRASLRTIKMHRKFLYSLFVQTSVHGAMLVFPIIIYIISLIFDFNVNGNLFSEYERYFPNLIEVAYIAIVTASLHGAMSTLTMIVLNKRLLHILAQLLRSVFFPKNIFPNYTSIIIPQISQQNTDPRNRSMFL